MKPIAFLIIILFAIQTFVFLIAFSLDNNPKNSFESEQGLRLLNTPDYSSSLNLQPQEYDNNLLKSSKNTDKTHISSSKNSGTNKASLVFSASAVNVGFQIKDENGLPMKDVLVIIQGVTNTGFSESKLTDSDGKTSFSLNQNEAFIYIVYKLSYKELTGSFFTSTGKEFSLTMEKYPENQWQFYYLNNGEIEIKVKSLDEDTLYSAGDYINKHSEVNNVGSVNIKLLEEQTKFQVVDSESLAVFKGWGNFNPGQQDQLTDIVLKPDGWIKATWADGSVEVCGGNIIAIYNGKPLELFGKEFICATGQGQNKIPGWILDNNYKLKSTFAYEINSEEKQVDFISQEFSIANNVFSPEFISIPGTELEENELWNYDAEIGDNEQFSYLLDKIKYKLVESPQGMSVDENTGAISWQAVEGSYEVTIRAYYEYFEGNSEKIAFNNQTFILEVSGQDNPTSNNAPLITSQPTLEVNDEYNYEYQVIATDTDSDTLAYSLTQKPSWLSIDSPTGLITGTAPNLNQDTGFTVVISVSDGKTTTTQSYTLTVKEHEETTIIDNPWRPGEDDLAFNK